MAEQTNPSNSNNIEMEGTANESSQFTQIGKIEANQVFIGDQSATPLLDKLEKSSESESVRVLKTGDSPKRIEYWQGRKDEIDQIYQWLTNDNICLIGIEGIGGTGKSVLASKIYEEIDEFPKRFWADVSSGAILFSDLARRVLTEFGSSVPDNELELVNALIQCLRSRQYLLVIDNLESLLTIERKWKSQFYQDFFNSWLEFGSNSKILITTRERPELMGFEWLLLKGLKTEEGANLLTELGITGEVTAFSELVDGHPLLLKIVANLIKNEYSQDPNIERLADLGLGNLQQLLTDSRVVCQHRRENVGMVLVLYASFNRLTLWQQKWLQNLSVYRGSFDGEAAKQMLTQVDESDALPKEIRDIEQELRQFVKRSLLEQQLTPKERFSFQPVVLEYLKFKAGNQNQAHSQAIAYFAQKVKQKPWQTLEDVKEYLEIVYHQCQLEEYANANEILSYCDNFLSLRGYYSTITEVNQPLVENWQPKDNEEKKNFGWVFNRLGNAYDSLGQYQTAIDYHQQHLEISKEIGDRYGQGNSLGNLGNAYDSLGQYQTAIDYHQQSLDIAREIGDRRGEGNSLGSLGNAYYSLGQYQTAIDYLQQWLEISKEIGDRRGEGSSLGNLGLAYDSLGEYQTAIDYHQQSLEISKEIGDRLGEGNSLGNLGNAYHSLGQYQTAIDYHQQWLEISKEIGDRRGEGNSLGNLGNAYHSLGQYQTAIDYHQQSLEISKEIGDRRGEGNSLGNLGNAYHSLGQYQTAIDYHQQSLEISKEIGDRRGEGNSLGNLGNAYHSLGQYQTAIDYHQQSLEISKEIGDRLGEGNSLGNLGNAYDSLGQYQTAIDYHQQHLEISKEIGDRLGEGNSLGNLGNAYDSLGQYQTAIDYHQQWLEISKEIGGRRGEANSLFNLGNSLSKIKQKSNAINAYKNARQLFQEMGLDSYVQMCDDAINKLSQSSGNWFKRLLRWFRNWLRRLLGG